ncbi:MAG TPA: hypothetical protein PK349_07670 [Candidatus Hydrogenedentes bacterium]|nr:hypothetical protein [Candidatus Hydrogenedentota bacterium]
MMATLLAVLVFAGTDCADLTNFQTPSGWRPEIDIASDMVMVYGTQKNFQERAESWKQRGYAVSMMTGISWGGYEEYYRTPDGLKKEEIQTVKSGKLLMHGNSDTVGYNVPTPAYVDFIKKVVDPAIDAGVCGIYLEEPEFWARAGWSEGFKRCWLDFYGEPWQEPDSSVDAQYRASKLKYELYFRALRDVFRHIKARAAEKGITIECHVPTHSLINYAHWGIVSPESHLLDLEEADGYIAQVWTGTARTPTVYRNVKKERTFESGLLEYAQMLSMARPAGRKVWLLADPVEDNPDRVWSDYKVNYECTVVASLLHPEASRFEVMPWPGRIFEGKYPASLEPDAPRVGISPDYATQLLAVIDALNHMGEEESVADLGAPGIAVVVSDTMMFQRAAPHPSDPDLSSFFGLAMPLIKMGTLPDILQLENLDRVGVPKDTRLIVLTYEGQKPLKASYHKVLADWVREGGCLLIVDDGNDPYHHVREWWNEQGANDRTPLDHLSETLGLGVTARNEPQAVGRGWVRWWEERPRRLARSATGADALLREINQLLEKRGDAPITGKNYFEIRRGPWIVTAVMDESVSDAPRVLKGNFVDVFDPALPVITEKSIAPNQRSLLYDLDWLTRKGTRAAVTVSAGRARNIRVTDNELAFTSRGPVNTTGRTRVLLPGPPEVVESDVECARTWHAESHTLLLEYPHQAREIAFSVRWRQAETTK